MKETYMENIKYAYNTEIDRIDKVKYKHYNNFGKSVTFSKNNSVLIKKENLEDKAEKCEEKPNSEPSIKSKQLYKVENEPFQNLNNKEVEVLDNNIHNNEVNDNNNDKKNMEEFLILYKTNLEKNNNIIKNQGFNFQNNDEEREREDFFKEVYSLLKLDFFFLE